MLNLIAANVIAGLGVFFSGLKLVDSHLKQVTGRQLRSIIGTLTKRPLTAGAVGLAVGVLVQSTSGIAFILVSLVSSGLTTVRRALPVMTWANVGCSALIFATVLDLRVAILYLIGVAGAAYAFDRSHKSHAVGAIFGIGMLFYGIELMKLGAEPLKDLPWLHSTLNGPQSSYLLAFAGATGMAFLTQSSVAVSILAIGLARAGLLGPFQTMMGIYGANVGSTFARMVLSSGLKGSVRQLTAYQDLFKITGAVLFVSLLYAEVFTQVPLVRALVEQVSGHLDRQMALVFLLFNLTTAVIFTVGQGAILGALERWLPADNHEDLSKAQFLYEEALDAPATALDLIEKEQLRLAQRLRAYPHAMRTGAGSPERARTAQADKPFAAVTALVDQFQHELVNRQLTPEETERLTNLQNRLSLLVYLEDSLRTLTASTEAVRVNGSLGILLSTFVEALDFVLMTMTQVLEAGDRSAHDLLVLITGDRGDLLERIRQEYLSDERSLTKADRAVLLQVTSTFERTIWMTQRFARLIEPGDQERPRVTAADGAEPAASLAGVEEMPSV